MFHLRNSHPFGERRTRRWVQNSRLVPLRTPQNQRETVTQMRPIDIIRPVGASWPEAKLLLLGLPPIPFPCGGGDLSEGVADRCTLINASSWVKLIRPQIQRRTLSVSFIAACLPPILSLDAVCRPSL